MSRSGARSVVFALVVLLLPLLPQGATLAAPDPAETAARIDSLMARGLKYLIAGEHDSAAQQLKAALELARDDTPRLARDYLLLIETYVVAGNYFKSEPQGREASLLFYREGRRYVEESLGLPQLRHLRPEPPTDYPPEMLAMFREARELRFGSLRLRKVVPSDAMVLLDGDTLSCAPPDSVLEVLDLAVGPHALLLRRGGYQDFKETVNISPGSMTERNFEMRPARGLVWYTTRGAVLLGGAVAFVVTRPDDHSSSGGPPLPAPTPLPR
jgi:hypothetical protein